MSITLVVVVVALSLGLIGIIAATCWDKGSDENQVKAEKEAIEQIDKAFESADDPNEPARWVP
jgi:hypothetical protein